MVSQHKNTSDLPANLLSLGVVYFLWPISVIVRTAASGFRPDILTQLKHRFAIQGIAIQMSDKVLNTFSNVIQNMFTEASKARGEKIPSAVFDEITLHYLEKLINNQSQGLGHTTDEMMHYQLMDSRIALGLDIFRQQGLKALISHIR